MANYLIIGGDGKEYGPVTDADVRQWITEGRLAASSLAKAESDAEFRPLANFPEFAGAFAGNAPAPIAPLKSSASADYLQRDYELDLGGCISRGYQLLKDNFSLLFLTTLVFGSIEVMIAVLGAIPFVGPIFSIANLVIAGPLMGGLYFVFLRVVRGEATEVGDIFAGFRRCFGQLFLGKLIPGLVAGLCVIPVIIAAVVVLVLPAMATPHQPPDLKKLLVLIPIGLVCLIPVAYLQTCWTFTLALIIDKEMDFGTAMKTSWKQVNRHWWQVFGLALLIGLVNLTGALACLVGLLFTMPIGIAAMMYAYETIFGETKN